MSTELGKGEMTTICSSVSAFTCLLVVGCVPGTRETTAPLQSVLPGTYSVEICRGPCRAGSSDALLSRGYLVIEGSAYPTSELPRAVREYVEFATDLLVRAEGEADPNACFVLSRPGEQVDTYAGTEPVGFTVLESHRADSVRVALFRSPDASYYAVLKVGRGTLRGRGRSRGFGDAAVSSPQDSVRARRIGPPDRGLCIRAAEEEAAALEARRHPPRP